MWKSQANTSSDQFQMLWPFGTDQASTCRRVSYWVFLNDNTKNVIVSTELSPWAFSFMYVLWGKYYSDNSWWLDVDMYSEIWYIKWREFWEWYVKWQVDGCIWH